MWKSAQNAQALVTAWVPSGLFQDTYWPIRFGRAPALAAKERTGPSESGAPGAWTPRNFPPAGRISPDTLYGRLPGTRVGVEAGGPAPGTPYSDDDPQAASAAPNTRPPR